ncbi:CD209 antigen-like protein A [Haliotis rufescens]|uniref:CD209 antigen-like protein A n=1 Tax=Haliotis rufescens TaxID=6454 RepID=UPI00201FA55B|nr:CD209 antigen-like protein A [Haliotis rufescens]
MPDVSAQFKACSIDMHSSRHATESINGLVYIIYERSQSYRITVMMTPLFLISSTLIHIAVSTCQNYSVTFERLLDYDDVNVMNISVSLNLIIDVNEVHKCADACALSSSCAVFYHDPVASCCILYPLIVIPSPNTGRSSPGSRHYQRRLQLPSDPTDWCAESKGWVQDEGSTICYSMSEDEAIWENAKRTCEDKGGQLMMFKDEDKTNKVLDIINGFYLYSTNVWIGMTDVETEGVFKWIDGTTLSNDHGTRSLINGGTEENCVMLHQGGIYDSDCGSEKRYLCENRQT